jgi:hypothetical protein
MRIIACRQQRFRRLKQGIVIRTKQVINMMLWRQQPLGTQAHLNTAELKAGTNATDGIR